MRDLGAVNPYQDEGRVTWPVEYRSHNSNPCIRLLSTGSATPKTAPCSTPNGYENSAVLILPSLERGMEIG